MKVYFHFSPSVFANSYLIGNEQTKEALIIDPCKITYKIIDQIETNGFDLKAVLITRSHDRSNENGTKTILKIYPSAVYAENSDIDGIKTQTLKGDGIIDAAGALQTQEPAHVILGILNTLPYPKTVLAVLVFTMIAFYSSTFDAITLVIASYSQKNLKKNEEPKKALRAFWSVVFILLPTALILTGADLSSLQMLSIIAAFPLGLIIILIVASFLKDLKKGD